MLYDSIYLSGYGIYVWPAFIFALTLLSAFYYSTKKKYLKYEKLFEDLSRYQSSYVEIEKAKKMNNKVFSASKAL